MVLSHRFIYDAGTDNNGGTDTNTTLPTPAASTELPEDIKKELEELRAFRESNKPADTKTPEQIAKEAETKRADFIKYSVDEDLMKVDDFSKFETFKSKADRDLVYESWFENWKAENPDVEKEEISAQAQRDFEEEYKLNSSNEKVKARGESRLHKEAKEIRNPLETSYKSAETQYQHYQTAKENLPKFHKAIDEIVKGSVPEELVYKTKEGEEDITIEGVKITAEDKVEIAKMFKEHKDSKYFVSFLQKKGDTTELKSAISKKIEGYLTNKYSKQIQDAIYEKAKGIGLAQGVKGSKNPFALLERHAGQEGGKVIDIDNSKANAAGEKARAQR